MAKPKGTATRGGFGGIVAWTTLLCGAALLMMCVLPLADRVVDAIPRASITADQGAAFLVDLEGLDVPFPQEPDPDSAVQLLEDGEPMLGRQLHADIRGRAKEGALFCAWGRWLYFRPSDGSDPRDNGRSYTLRVPRRAGAALGLSDASLLGLGLALLALGASILYARGLRAAGCSGTHLVPVLIGILLLVALAAFLDANVLDVSRATWRIAYGVLALLVLLALPILLFFRARLLRKDTQGPGGMARVFDKTLVLLPSLGAILLALECGARAFPFVDSLDLNPGIDYFWRDHDSPRNSLGWKEREVEPKRGPRILVLGDSFVEGAGVSRAQRFTDQLAALYRSEATDVHVLNAGACGFDTLHEAERLEAQGDRVQPDLIVLGYCLNDAEGANPEHRQKASVWTRFFLRKARSYFYYRAWNTVRGLLRSYAKTLQSEYGDESPGWSRVVDGFDRIRAWAKPRGVPVAVLVMPFFWAKAPAFEDEMERVVQLARSKGFRAWSALGDFDGRWADFAFSAVDAHPSAAAHAILAQKLKERLGPVRAAPPRAR